MPQDFKSSVTAMLLLLLSIPVAAQVSGPNNRAIRAISKTIRSFPMKGYSDQPYVAITSDGEWLRVITTDKGLEGEGGQRF